MPNRLILLPIGALILVANAPAEIPSGLQSYVVEGKFDPGDYGWMRGEFIDATDAQKDDLAAIDAWAATCLAQSQEKTAAAFAERGIEVGDLKYGAGEMPVCAQVALRSRFDQPITFAEFERRRALVEPVLRTLERAVEISEDRPHDPGAGLRHELLDRPLGEQMLRQAYSWSGAPPGESNNPHIDPQARSIFESELSMMIVPRDFDNTLWLKSIVADGGWPTISKVGQQASTMAWLLVQHADHDPAFQFDVLELMEPLVAAKEVSTQNYAYLYDRVHLKLEGMQRYATQMTCEGGRRVPQPLENPAGVDALRADIGLEPIEEYLTWFPPCPPVN